MKRQYEQPSIRMKNRATNSLPSRRQMVRWSMFEFTSSWPWSEFEYRSSLPFEHITFILAVAVGLRYQSLGSPGYRSKKVSELLFSIC